jgi:hypothetical protein
VSLAPDYCEPVVAWRVWHVVENGGALLLSSVYRRVTWPRGRALEAVCDRARLPFLSSRRSRHEAPAERCQCGIYAADAYGAQEYLPGGSHPPSAYPVIGRVSLWGEVVECDRGWRASHAYPERIYVPRLEGSRMDRARLAARLEGYGVPVTVLDATTRDGIVDPVASSVDARARSVLETWGVSVLVPDSWRFWSR